MTRISNARKMLRLRAKSKRESGTTHFVSKAKQAALKNMDELKHG